MGVFEQIYDKFLSNTKNSFVEVANNISKFDGINLNNLVVYAPKNLVELNKVIDCVACGQSIIINFASIAKGDCVGFSNYLSGAVYALKAQVFKLENQLFVIAPKNIKISTL